MNNIRKVFIWGLAIVLFQGVIYWYFDQVLLAPESSYQVTAVDTMALVNGRAYYSADRQYLAVVKTGVVEIYTADNKLLRTIDIGRQKVSYFKWLVDRNLALMALQEDVAGRSQVILTRVSPVSEGREVSAAIKGLPSGAIITNVAYSTATNAVYIQVMVGRKPDLYRIYRTDANHNLQRVYVSANRIGRIATLFDLDYLIYDNLKDGVVIARRTDGNWTRISPALGKYCLVGTQGDNIYIARLDSKGLATVILRGGIKTKFTEVKTLANPTDVDDLTFSAVDLGAIH